jgi:hypothetical protein
MKSTISAASADIELTMMAVHKTATHRKCFLSKDADSFSLDLS